MDQWHLYPAHTATRARPYIYVYERYKLALGTSGTACPEPTEQQPKQCASTWHASQKEASPKAGPSRATRSSCPASSCARQWHACQFDLGGKGKGAAARRTGTVALVAQAASTRARWHPGARGSGQLPNAAGRPFATRIGRFSSRKSLSSAPGFGGFASTLANRCLACAHTGGTWAKVRTIGPQFYQHAYQVKRDLAVNAVLGRPDRRLRLFARLLCRLQNRLHNIAVVIWLCRAKGCDVQRGVATDCGPRRQEAFIEVDAFLDERLQLHQLAIAHSFAHDEGGVRVVSHVRHRTKLVRSASQRHKPTRNSPYRQASGVKDGICLPVSEHARVRGEDVHSYVLISSSELFASPRPF